MMGKELITPHKKVRFLSRLLDIFPGRGIMKVSKEMVF